MAAAPAAPPGGAAAVHGSVENSAGTCWKCKGNGKVVKRVKVRGKSRVERKRRRIEGADDEGGGTATGGASKAGEAPAAVRRSGGDGNGGAGAAGASAGAGGGGGGAATQATQVEVECKVCNGSGRLARKRRSGKRTAVEFEAGAAAWREKWAARGWTPRGPVPPKEAVAAAVGAGEIDDAEITALCGHWRIYQPVARHRFSTDDVCTAWYACEMVRRRGHRVSRHADIGTGVGSVLLMTAWRLQDQGVTGVKHVGVEAQRTRAALAERSVIYNGLSDNVSVVNGDLRSIESLEESTRGPFDLVTGTPPYFDVTQGGLPPDAESAACLFEIRGGIEEYCAAAASVLRPGCLFIVAETAAESLKPRPRVCKAAQAAGLTVSSVLDVIPREGKPALFSVWAMELPVDGSGSAGGAGAPAKAADIDPDKVPVETIVVRAADGSHTPDYVKVMDDMGFPVCRK